MAGLTTIECGDWLMSVLAQSDRAQVDWLDALAEFDICQGWAGDGQLSCAEWLMWRGRLSRSSAYEKLQVAHQLRRRPVLHDALAEGRISYSVARAMARMTNPDPEVDEAIIRVAEPGTVRDVERLVGVYLRHADQHRRPSGEGHRRGVRVRPGYDGTSTIEITLEDIEVEEFMASLGAVATTSQPRDVEEDEDQSARVDSDKTGEAPVETPSWQAQRADAALVMARTALLRAGDGQACGADRYLVHVVMHQDDMTTLEGTPLDPAAAERIKCDSSQVKLLLGRDWEPLAMGRKTHQWTTAQRRAARVRDRGRCRFPGCTRTVADIHHGQWWSRGGPTDISNGFLVCPRHHTMLHDGYTSTGDANGQLQFQRPDGSMLGSSSAWIKGPLTCGGR